MIGIVWIHTTFRHLSLMHFFYLISTMGNTESCEQWKDVKNQFTNHHTLIHPITISKYVRMWPVWSCILKSDEIFLQQICILQWCVSCMHRPVIGASPWQQSTVLRGLFILHCAGLAPPSSKCGWHVCSLCKRTFSSDSTGDTKCLVSFL